MADLAVLRAGGWEGLALPEIVARYPTMLTVEERQLLHWLARDVWEGRGAIVDAGSFLGGSTVSLATGLRARARRPTAAPRPPISTYDLFVADDYEVAAGYFERWPEIGVGDSFRHAFDELLGELACETTVNEGDVVEVPWAGEPIEILFLDLLKAPYVNDSVLAHCLPALEGGRSVLIQQDYVHAFLPWIHVSMELLADSVEHIADMGASRVYAVTRDISAERLAEMLPLDEKVPAARQCELMEQAVWATSSDTRGSLLLALANLLRKQGDLAAAGRLLVHVEQVYADAPLPMFDVPGTRAGLERRGWRDDAPA